MFTSLAYDLSLLGWLFRCARYAAGGAPACRFRSVAKRKSDVKKTRRLLSMASAGSVVVAGVLIAVAVQPPARSAPAIVSAATPPALSVTGIPAVQIDNRGHWLALITKQAGKAILTVEHVDGSDAKAVSIPGGCAPTAIRWARDGSGLAVLTRCARDAAHPRPTGALWVMNVQRGSPLRRLVDFDGTASQVQWRGDGKVVAFRFTPSASAGSGHPATSVIMAGSITGGRFVPASPAKLDVHAFYLPANGSGFVFTATPAGSPAALPALYKAANSKIVQLVDPATANGALRGLRISEPRVPGTAVHLPGTVSVSWPASFLFLAHAASGSSLGNDMYWRSASGAASVVNVTAKTANKPGWFAANRAIATHVADGETQVMGYVAAISVVGSNQHHHTRLLCTVPGTVTDGHGAGSIAVSGAGYAYIEYPRSGDPASLNVGLWNKGLWHAGDPSCTPHWSRPLVDPAATVAKAG